MDGSDWSNGIRYHIFVTRPDTEFNQWRASTCFAAKMIPSFPGNLAFDDLAFDNFPIMSFA